MAMRLRERVRRFAYAMGFGSDGEAERKVLDGEANVPPGSLMPGRLMAVQIGKNKWTPDKDIEAVKRDYVYCVQRLGKYADIIVVNVSSPNTPGLRTLQRVEPLTRILKGVVDAVAEIPRKTKPRVMVKVSPDEDGEEQVKGICDAMWESGIDGVVVANTTNQRPDPLPKGYVLPHEEAVLMSEPGGYSGPQMFERTLALVKRYRKLLDDGPGSEAVTKGAALASASKMSMPPREPKVIFATGGITNGKRALEILDAGASAAMVYTALVYGGAGTITRIKREMKDEIARGANR
jgi:dihydroorotate dehydrogenase